MSHIMIGVLRSLGIPAGYVSGFLRTSPPPGRPRLEGADAMHAWVRAWCGPQAGWLDYDPTNDCVAGPNHIEVAQGRDYADVSPVKGMLRVAGAQTSRQSVDVIPREA
jgi:transglutaminase-like putative cysteine protease